MAHLVKPASSDLSDLLQVVQARTPARILTGRAGPAYRTATQLALRQDHAAAIDAVQTELNLPRDFGQPFVERWGLFEVTTCASSKAEYLLRPDLGRRLSERSQAEVLKQCPADIDLQIVIGDGLS